MNKAELKKFAVEARGDLMAKVSLKAEQYGITKANQDLKIEENYGKLFINGNPYPIERKHAFHTLKQRLQSAGYDQLIEEVAYTWFNRIIAIRYMEVNNYLPDRVNVLSSSTGKNEPDILLQYETMNLDVDYQQINEWIQKGESEQAYRKLFVAQCNSLNKLLPFLFEKIDDFTELLLPDYLLDQESIIRKIVNGLSDENFFQINEDGSRSDNVEVLGWLYQYYMSEKKEQVGGLRNNAVKKEDLPVVTQLFTPKWIVQYMVQNSLGKLYDEKYEDNKLAQNWEYYLKHEENYHLYPEFESLEDLKIMDPACGSGHILIYAFEMLYDMYEEAGYPSREIPQLILEKNLYGLDIDKRAQQIANFALLMKAAEKQPRFISRLSRKGISPKLNVYEIIDVDQSLSQEAIDYFVENETERSLFNKLLSQFENGKQFGSLIIPLEIPYEEWIIRVDNLEKQQDDLIEESYSKELINKLVPILKQAYLLFLKYDVVVTNPPYHSKYNKVLKQFINKYYENYKYDLYSAFIYRANQMVTTNGFSALMTPFTWMFISRHEKLREYLIKNTSISSLIQLEYSAFEEATVPICTFVIQNQTHNTLGQYVRLSQFRGSNNQPMKVKEAVKNREIEYRNVYESKNFIEIPGSPLAYWASEQERQLFKDNKLVGDVVTSPSQNVTGNNSMYLRFFWEIDTLKHFFNDGYWRFYAKGGGYRKWFGNLLELINWSPEAREVYRKGHASQIIPEEFWYKHGITWGLITSSNASFRMLPSHATFDKGGSSIFPQNNDENLLHYILAFLNSKTAFYLLSFLSPTLNFQVRDIKSLPLIQENGDKVISITKELVRLSEDDWNSFETSWEFKKHPFLLCKDNKDSKLQTAFCGWKELSENRFNYHKENEIKLNEIFIESYGLANKLSPEIEESEITISISKRERDTISFLSYFIGCVYGTLFPRYRRSCECRW
ncbi:BREX-1 system adenine-specific DNA-methyltransferase PglX [Metabacillus mangrovi]|uniref:BREX-1 system adenine-specific DNA-methyltransferase PglX n=1 Tax=Metabacillus mangrovi TaxID=1491830 RepID=UPI001F50268E|nr:BREX-1 system adenine-specific DNA-methyltransferase PglX [Metabacillus mangrovi]